MGINDAYRGVNAFITGSNRGLGYGFARHLLKYPISNVFAGFRDFDNAKDLRQLAEKDERLSLIKIDVTEDESIRQATRIVESKVGAQGLHLLINNSGIFNDKSSPDHPNRENMLQAFNVNALGPVIVTSMFLPLLQKAATLDKPSKIINMSSIAGSIENIPEQQFWMKNSTYSMTKSALNAYTKFFGFLDHGNIITVALHPGWVQTRDSHAELTIDDAVSTMLETIGRLKRKHSSSFIDNHGQPIPN